MNTLILLKHIGCARKLFVDRFFISALLTTKRCKAVVAVTLLLIGSHTAMAKVLSKSVYRDMSAVQEDVQNEQYQNAKDKLNNMLTKEKKLSDYDKAKIHEMLTNVNVGLGNYPEATAAAERALLLNALEQASINLLHHRLFYLHYFAENYPKALHHIEIWFASESAPDIQSYFSTAQVYALSGDYDKAQTYARAGMQKHLDTADSKPVETWFQLLISIYMQQKNFSDAAQILEEALTLWPHHVNYYRQLNAVYQQEKREQEALVMLSLAYRNGILDQAQDLESLIQQYRYHNHPHQGARIYATALSNKTLEATESHWETFANTLIQAREWSQANKALTQAAEMSDAGKHWLRLCQTSFQEEQWKISANHCQKAIKRGGLEKEQGSAWYLVALANYYQNLYPAAKNAFGKCKEWNKTQEDCQHWELYVAQVQQDKKEEQERLEQIAMEREARKLSQQDEVEQALLLRGRKF